MSFREQLLATLRAIQPVLRVPGVTVVGSELPNLLEPNVATTLVISKDVDVAVPVTVHREVKEQLRHVRGLHPSAEEPSVWLPESEELIEVNFVGRDDSLADPDDSYLLEDAELPLLVFGLLSLAGKGRLCQVEAIELTLPSNAGLLLTAGEEDLVEVESLYLRLRPDLRYAARSNLSLLSLLEARRGMPDPRLHRARVATLLRRLEVLEPDL